MNSDSEEVYLPFDIGQAATQGDFERVKAWLAGGSASDPRSINGGDGTGWTLLHWTMIGDRRPGHLEFARYLLVARGRVKLPSRTRRRSPRGRQARQARALEFVVRQGDNGIVWNILSFWRETA